MNSCMDSVRNQHCLEPGKNTCINWVHRRKQRLEQIQLVDCLNKRLISKFLKIIYVFYFKKERFV